MSLAIEALEMARAGLQWYRDRHPEDVDGSDDEADRKIEAAIAELRAAPTPAPTPAQVEAMLTEFKEALLAGDMRRARIAHRVLLDAYDVQYARKGTV